MNRKLLIVLSIAAICIPGADAKTYTCTTYTCPGTESADSITGTSLNQQFDLLGGNDYADGAGGPDFIKGYGGRDTELGGNGDDNLIGDDGNDTLKGEGGLFNTVTGGGGDDSLYDVNGSTGGDINGGGGTDDCHGDWSRSTGYHDSMSGCEFKYWSYIG